MKSFRGAKTATLLKSVGESSLALLYPRHCALCRCALEAEAEDLCADCARYLLPLEAPFCQRCSEPMAGAVGIGGEAICENCLGHRWKLDGAVCALRSSAAAWELVHAFKYAKRSHLAPLLGRRLRRVLEDERIRGRHFDAIVPVPLYRAREQERGFNQAHLLAEQLESNIPVRALLSRVRETGTQTRLSRRGRQENLRGAFGIRRSLVDRIRRRPVSEQIMGRAFLMIDDVFTTGSTLDECARVLKAAGAREVWAATLVRAGGAD